MRLAPALVAFFLLAVPGAGPATAADVPGDPARGRGLFADKGCARCHHPRGQPGLGPALEELRRPQGALELAGRLWNHAPAMFALLKQEEREWPRISAQEMADLMAYLQGNPARDPVPDLSQGQVLLVRKGCLKCHQLRGEGGTVGIDLTKYHGRYASPIAWATTIWNHSPQMAAHSARLGLLYPRFSGEEMGNLVGFLRAATQASPQ